MFRYSKHALLCGAFAATFIPQFAAAQTSDSSGIETVVVTAEKRAENVQDVPISMVALQRGDLEKYNTSSVADLMTSVPNLYVGQSPANNAIYMRGFGSAPTNFAFDQTVSLYQDGIYGGRSRQFMEPFFDVDRVEVLRGPQGALLGKNTAAGAVSIVTANPTDDFEAQATGDYDFDRSGFDVYGYASGPVADNFGARLALKLTSLDGYLHNTFNNTYVPTDHEQLGRLTLRYEPTANVDITTKLQYGNSDIRGMNTVLLSATSHQPPAKTQDSGPKLGTTPRDMMTDWNSATTINARFGGYTLTSVTGYSQFKDSKIFFGGVNPNPLEYTETIGESFDQVSQELQLFSPTGQTVEWIAGAYYDESDDAIDTIQRYDVFGGFLNGQGHQPFHQHAQSVSVFAQATYHITDDLRLLGSVRYTDVSKSGTFQQIADFGGQLSPPGPLVRGKTNNANVDPSVTLQYDVRPGFMVYASYARGSKSGGFVSNVGSTTAATFTYKPERSTNYEVGAKTSLFDDRVLADVSLYYLTFKDLQVSVYNPVTLGFVTGNAASATSKGVEATVSWLPIDNLEFTANGAYLDAHYDDFPGATCLSAAAINAPPCVGGRTNLKGYPLFYSSKWTGDVSADYNTPITDSLKFAANVTVSFRSRFSVSTDGNPNYGFQNGFAKLDARVQIGSPDDKWVLAVVGKNLTNVETLSQSYFWPLSSPAEAVGIINPTREFSIEAKYRF